MGEPHEIPVTWIRVRKGHREYDFPYLHIHRKRQISLNGIALDLLGRPAAVKIGVTHDGRLAVAPTDENDADGYHVTYAKKSRVGAINRPKLVDALVRLGYGMSGKFKLSWNEELKMLVEDKA